eukprot:g20404.t1
MYDLSPTRKISPKKQAAANSAATSRNLRGPPYSVFAFASFGQAFQEANPESGPTREDGEEFFVVGKGIQRSFADGLVSVFPPQGMEGFPVCKIPRAGGVERALVSWRSLSRWRFGQLPLVGRLKGLVSCS